MALTRKKRIFADAWARGASKAEAAIAAGYSEKTAPQAGSRMAKDPEILAEVARLGLPVPAPSKAGRKPKKPTAPENVSAQPQAKAYTDANGVKTADAPSGWPFGVEPPVAPTATVPPPVPPTPEHFDDPLEYLKHVVNDLNADPKERLDAAKAWTGYVHARKAPVGKKAGKEQAAADVMGAGGGPNPFAPRRRLEAVK